MRRLILLLCLMLSAPCFAQEPQPEVIALSAEDAATCEAPGCAMITAQALDAIKARLRRLEQLEQIAEAMAAELRQRPARTNCI